ncbi:hypothetical protein EOA22_09265 [Mesorhizobium sp. M7A.F.Ca.US.014.04.1.1]|uniref:hypothetical protein n=2 Tax=Phyllobacteriaceae TaxID=69277 RepID=UPI000FCBE2DD|nr:MULTISPECIES: hypothetical protein [Mesorhizobium]MDF3207965.1 hypothetical protein [Mesorhizobium sp. LMG15046]MDF3229463.1 hypothetical protein [Mesorhizobium sp. DSM 30133]RUU22561.1 hypothetical protein EOC84_05480 [Mesorhizobium sp. Primo-B]RUU35903.1 hypothetical protein EOC83_24030 [Mesorhizobium sp. Primo-A]RUX13243.1 hypothetical protein EN996_20880 [Mesorhizobium sp. M7A.F.Ca.CA.002.14.1.2]
MCLIPIFVQGTVSHGSFSAIVNPACAAICQDIVRPHTSSPVENRYSSYDGSKGVHWTHTDPKTGKKQEIAIGIGEDINADFDLSPEGKSKPGAKDFEKAAQEAKQYLGTVPGLKDVAKQAGFLLDNPRNDALGKKWRERIESVKKSAEKKIEKAEKKTGGDGGQDKKPAGKKP